MANSYPIPEEKQDDERQRNVLLSEALIALWKGENIRSLRRIQTHWIIDVGPLPGSTEQVQVTETPRTEELRNAALAKALKSAALKGKGVRAIRRTNTGWELDLI